MKIMPNVLTGKRSKVLTAKPFGTNAGSIRAFSVLMLTVLLACFVPAAHSADSKEVRQSALDAWQSGKAVALMRHALAPGMGDPADFAVGDCTTQRNLSADGRAQAQAIGDSLRTRGLSDLIVETSAWCRCVDTAQLLGFAKPVVNPALNSLFRRSDNTEQQTNLIKRSIEQWVTAGSDPRILVTHQVNIRALTGQSTSSGDIQIVTYQDDEVVLLGSLPATLVD